MNKNRSLAVPAWFFMAIAMLFLGLAGSAADPSKQAKAKFNEESWDFGKVKQGEVLTHEFDFKNEGEATLVIQGVTTSCGCTAALASEEKIEPGRKGKIKATFNTDGYSGKVVKHVYVQSNDAVRARRELSIAVDIEVPLRPRIELDRYNIDIGLSVIGEETSAKVTVRNTGQLELNIDIPRAEMALFFRGKPAVFPIGIAAGKSAEIEIRFAGQKKTGMLRDYVLIKSNDPVRSALSLYISRYVITREELKKIFVKYKKLISE